MIRGCLEPGLLILVCCHAGAWLAQGVSNTAQHLSAQLRPCDHVCTHCGYLNAVEIEDLLYCCDACQAHNNRLGELLANWHGATDSDARQAPPASSDATEISVTGL